MRVLVLLLPLAALLADASPAPAAETLVDCPAFRARWSASDSEAGRPPVTFERVSRPRGAERVLGRGGIEGQIVCLDGKLSRLELVEAPAPGDKAQPFGGYAAPALVALQTDLSPADAERMVATLGAETERGRDAVSQWGPYEIVVMRAQPGRRSKFVISFPEN